MISLKNAKKVFRGAAFETVALDEINLEIDKGEFVAVMGKSGSGKSTLLNIIGCLDKLTGGSYSLDGVDVCNLGAIRLDKIRKEKISFIFQNYELMKIFKAIHQSGKTILMVTHDKDVAAYADRIIELHDGKII